MEARAVKSWDCSILWVSRDHFLLLSSAVNQLICHISQINFFSAVSSTYSIADIIDGFLLVADKNNDGYLNFNEYKETLRDTTDHEPGAGDYPDEDADHKLD